MRSTQARVFSAAMAVMVLAALLSGTVQAGKLPAMITAGAGALGERFSFGTAAATDGLTGGISFSGDLLIFDAAQGKFVPFSGDSFKEGDCFMTGPTAETNLSFTSTSSAAVGPNSTFCMQHFSADPDTGELFVSFDLGIGDVSFDVNEPGGINMTLETPVGIIHGDENSFAYDAEIVFPGTEGLTPEELAVFIQNNPLFTQKEVVQNPDGSYSVVGGAVDPALLAELGNTILMDVNVTGGTVEVGTIGEDGKIVMQPLVQGQTLSLDLAPVDPKVLAVVIDELQSTATATPQPTAVPFFTPTPRPTDNPPPNPCGDGVCDIYAGENNLTCSVDCAP